MKVAAHKEIFQALEKPLKLANLPGKFFKMLCFDILLLSG